MKSWIKEFDDISSIVAPLVNNLIDFLASKTTELKEIKAYTGFPVGAATYHPQIAIPLFNKKTINYYVIQPCIRPADESLRDLYRGEIHFQFNCIIKWNESSCSDIANQLKEILKTHVDANCKTYIKTSSWSSKTLGAFGDGYEIGVIAYGLEIEVAQITLFDKIGCSKIPPHLEVTFGLDRVAFCNGYNTKREKLNLSKMLSVSTMSPYEEYLLKSHQIDIDETKYDIFFNSDRINYMRESVDRFRKVAKMIKSLTTKELDRTYLKTKKIKLQKRTIKENIAIRKFEEESVGIKQVDIETVDKIFKICSHIVYATPTLAQKTPKLTSDLLLAKNLDDVEIAKKRHSNILAIPEILIGSKHPKSSKNKNDPYKIRQRIKEINENLENKQEKKALIDAMSYHKVEPEKAITAISYKEIPAQTLKRFTKILKMYNINLSSGVSYASNYLLEMFEKIVSNFRFENKLLYTNLILRMVGGFNFPNKPA